MLCGEGAETEYIVELREYNTTDDSNAMILRLGLHYEKKQRPMKDAVE